MSFCKWESEEHFRDTFTSGVYVCAECGYELFSSVTKYAHSSPWPAFTRPMHTDSLIKVPDGTQSLANAFKVSCGKCGLGLGHEFLNDGPNKVGSRF